jgi:HSP20 family protein
MRTSPRYEITEDEAAFQLAVDLPGVKASDIEIKLEEDGHFLSISGKRETKGDYYQFMSSFSQCFPIDPSVDLDQISANLNDGVLIVTAPKDAKKLEQTSRKIPVMEVRSVDEVAAKDSKPAEGQATADKPTEVGQASEEEPTEARKDSIPGDDEDIEVKRA